MLAWNGRRVAITGATGFVGYHVALDLRRHGVHVTALVRATSDVRRLMTIGVECKTVSLDDSDAVARTVEGCEFVIHVAGAVGFGNEWEPYYRGNVNVSRHLLDAARRAGVRRFVHTSSICAVGAAETPRLLDETTAWNLRSYRVPYVSTKRWAEEIALAANGKGLEVVVVNPASVIGPDDFTGSEFRVNANVAVPAAMEAPTKWRREMGVFISAPR